MRASAAPLCRPTYRYCRPLEGQRCAQPFGSYALIESDLTFTLGEAP